MAPILRAFESGSGRIGRKEYFPGTEVDQPNYHVLLDGRTVGPYDRKTIVGMRIKRMLTGDHLLVASDGTRLTVRELVGGPSAGPSAKRGASGRPGASPVLGTYTGILMEAGRRGIAVPPFKGELEVRVHADFLRLAGRRRRGFGWKDDRVKIALADVGHARAKGPRVDVWLQPPGSERLQRLALHMFTAEAAEELLHCLPPATTDPDQPGAARVRAAEARPAVPAARALAAAVLGISAVIALVLLVLMSARPF